VTLPSSSPSLATSTDGPTLPRLAAILGHCDRASQLLRAGAVDINARDHEGDTALDRIAWYGRDEVERFAYF